MEYKVKQGQKNANQRTIVIHREIPKKDSGKTFLMVYEDVITQASRNIKGEVAFKLFLYLLANQDNFSLIYSPQHFANTYGVCLDSAKKAIKALMDVGYIQQVSNLLYSFYENPILAKPALKVGRRVVHIIDADTGEYLSYTLAELVDYFDGDTTAAKNAWDYAVEANGGVYNE